MSDFRQDVQFAIRTLAKQPALAVAAILTLALGIGANTAIFSVVDAALLKPPPFREPGRLVIAWSSNPDLARQAGLKDKLPVSYGDFYDWQRSLRSFSHLALAGGSHVTMSGAGEPVQLGAVAATADFAATLGTPALLGRTLLPADDVPGDPSVMVLSYNFWQHRFGGDPRVLGRKVYLDRHPATIVGVMPPRFAFPRGSDMPAGFGFAGDPDAWIPLGLTAEQRQNRGGHSAIAFGRLRPGVGIAGAEKELRALCGRLSREHADTETGWSAYLSPLGEELVSNIRPALLVLWAAVGCVLLIACANVANLLLARAASRHKEIAVRTAIGASRGRLVRQLLTECGLLALGGGILGVGLAAVGLRVFGALVPAGLAGAATYTLDLGVLAWTAGLCFVATLLAGLVPALQMSRPDLAEALREGTRAGAGGVGSRRTRGALVMAEVALAVVLLIGAGLLLRSFERILDVDPGFRTAQVLSFQLDQARDQRPGPQLERFFERMNARLQSLPGVVAAGAVSNLPLGGDDDINGYNLEGRPMANPNDFVVADDREILPGYFETMGIPLKRGRYLGASDTASAPKVAVINDAMARTYWPDQDAIGKRFRSAAPEKSQAEDPKNPWVTIVGVVGSVRHSSLNADPRPQVYKPAAQVTEHMVPSEFDFVLRTGGDPAALTTAVRRAVHELDPDAAVSRIRTLDQVVASSVAPRRFNLLLLGLFAGLALALAAVGIYGITSYAVVQRTRELGLRLALGARPSALLRLLLVEALWLAAAGLIAGLAAALVLTRVLTSLLYGVGSTDPLTFAAVSLGLLLIALLSAWVPGRRATQLDPMIALRADAI